MLDNPAEALAQSQLLRETLREFLHVDDEELLSRIEPELQFRNLEAGATLFRQGDSARDVYFVLSGRLRALRTSERGQALILGEVARGETVGELAMVTGEARSATVIAVRDSLVAQMSQATFERVLASRPKVAMAVMRTVVDRFRRAERAQRAPKKPVNICLLPVTDGTNLEDFAARFAALRQNYGGPIRTLARRDLEQTFSASDRKHATERYGPVAGWLAAAEAQSEALVLVADQDGSPWTECCVQRADEIFLLARADATPKVSEPEARFLDGDAPEPIAMQTLVLLHEEDKRSPIGTARWLDRRPVARHFHVRPTLERDIRRLARIAAGRGVGIVLSGGGARGFAHIGVLNALADAGVEPDFIGGTSIGSVMGAWRAMDVRGAALVDAGRNVFVTSGGPTGDYNILPLVSLIRGKKTRAITERAVREAAGADIDIEDTWISYFCIAGNYSTAAEVVLTRGPLAKAILASYAIPGALPPIILGGHFLVDGGTVNNLPVDVMERVAGGTIIAIDLLADYVRTVDFDWVPSTGALLFDRLRPKSKRRYPLPSLPEMLVNAASLHSTGHQKEMRERAHICFRPPLPGVRLLDWRKYDAVVRSAYDSAKEQIAGLDPALLARLR